MAKKVVNVLLVVATAGLLAFFAQHVRVRPLPDKVAVLRTSGMTCGSCATRIEQAVGRLPGVAGIEVDLAGGWVLVGFDSSRAKPDTFAAAVDKAGFRCAMTSQVSTSEFRCQTGRNFGTKAVQSCCCNRDRCGSAKTK